MRTLRLLSRYRALFAYLAIIAVIALPLFGHLDEFPIQVWDEMRNGENALEMNRTGRLIVTTYDYEPETWNTKPPLLIWILALSFRLLGNTELALRLPSAIAAALTCLLVARFAKRHLGQWLPGILAVIVLVTTPGYVTVHGTRTGDYDALLVLCTTAAFFWLYNYLECEEKRWLYWSAAALTAAVLTKGVAGLLICPAMLAYAVMRGRTALLFSRRDFYLCLTAALIIIGGYYGLRELQQPGYLNAVGVNELGGRFGTVIPGIDESDPWYYFRQLANVCFTPWILLVVPAVLAGIAVRRRKWRRVALMCGLMAAGHLIILSCASTRLWWYIMPVYPGLALLCGLLVAELMMIFRKWEPAGRILRLNILPLLLLLALAFTPYKDILDSTIGDKFPKRYPDIHDAGIYLKEGISGQRKLNATILCGLNPLPLRWYQEVVRIQGKKLDVHDVDTLMAGAQVLAWDEPTKKRIRERYRQRETETFRSLTVFHIEGSADDTAHIQQRPTEKF